MWLVIKISLRNLFRQKRRNILLGIAIAVGMMILVMANSFSRGLSDMIFNQMLVYSYGHVGISVIENGQIRGGVIRDKDRIIKVIEKNIPGLSSVNQYLANFTRVVGNGKSDMLAIVGMPISNALDFFPNEMKEGNFNDFTNKDIAVPIVIYENKAKDLNVKVGDTISMRTTTIYGQVQSARMTVIGIMKTANLFQSMAAYIPHEKQKELLGYKPQESGPLQVVFKKMEKPILALKEANKIHELLKPNLALAYGSLSAGGKKAEATIVPFFTNTNAMPLLEKNLVLEKGKWVASTNSNVVLLGSQTAKKLNASIGTTLTSVYQNRFGGSTTNTYKVAGILKQTDLLPSDVLLINENSYYKGYYRNLPADVTNFTKVGEPKSGSAIYPALATEWVLLPRTKDNQSYEDKIRKISKEKWEGAYLDVSTMYEVASFILQLEFALNVITIIAVVVLFFIILIGVVNTLRMTIRERTREIGTIRAIGMQQNAVRNTFVMETLFLTLFACITGIILGFTFMGLLSLITINTDSMFSGFLMKKHLHFVWKFSSIFTYMLIILAIAGITAYFPAKKAAQKSAAEALRHYE